VNQLARTILDVAALADPDRGVITNVGPLFCDQPTNVVSDMARAWGNVRFATEMLGDELGRRIDSMATTTTDPPRVCVHRSFNRPSKPATPAVMALAEVARSAAADLGQSLPYGRTGGVCDGNNMQGAGLATIDTLGVRGGGLHTQQEWIEIPSLVERCQLAALVAARLSGNS
jgi:glutamate carboxypeptidase